METERGPEQSESVAQRFVRVEVDEENKKFTKQCEADGCTAEFTTNVPRKFFENPDDKSTELHENGEGKIAGTDILAADVERHMLSRAFEHAYTSPASEIAA
ncbi:MAG: hypothetical protein AAB445_01665 [Patescibacteria group bacterium]